MGKKLSIGATIALMAVTAAVTFTLSYQFAMQRFNATMANVNERQAMYDKLSEVDTSVRQNYLGEIDEKTLADGICSGYISGLQDSQGRYLDAEAYREYVDGDNQKVIGIGIQAIQDSDGNIEVVHVVPGSPAEKSGILKGDLITAVDGADVRVIGYQAGLSRLNAEVGAVSSLGIVRRTEGQESQPEGELVTIQMDVAHEEYQDVTVEAYPLGGLGYLSIFSFTEDTESQFQEAVESLKKQGAAGLVLDLRGNAGGNVEYAAGVLDHILPAGNLIGTVDKNGEEAFLYHSDAKALDLPLCVLVNNATSGAGELVASAIKDYGKAEIIGEKTAGKGTLDKVFPLSDGSAVIFSICHYITPKSGVFTGVGIEPTKQVPMTEDQRRLLDRKALPEANDPPLQAAITALGGANAPESEGFLPEETASAAAESPQQ